MPGIESIERQLTETDYARLTKLAASLPHPELDALLMAAEVVPARAIDADVVTMYSKLEFEDVRTGQRHALVICYPRDAEPTAGYVSVLSPVGMGLLGLRAGRTGRWRTPAGEEVAARVLAVPFQPEATGDYVT